jgi:hypothetical protein
VPLLITVGGALAFGLFVFLMANTTPIPTSPAHGLAAASAPAPGKFDRHNLRTIQPPGSGALGQAPYASMLLYTHKDNDEALYAHVPRSFVDTAVPLLLVDQITHGVGIREIMLDWDPGSVVSQDVVAWERVAQRTLALVARVQVGARVVSLRGENDSSRPRALSTSAPPPPSPPPHSQTFRGGPTSSVAKSYASGVLFAFPIADEDKYGYIVNATHLALSPPGVARKNDLTAAIQRAFGAQYEYGLDRSR